MPSALSHARSVGGIAAQNRLRARGVEDLSARSHRSKRAALSVLPVWRDDATGPARDGPASSERVQGVMSTELRIAADLLTIAAMRNSVDIKIGRAHV